MCDVISIFSIPAQYYAYTSFLAVDDLQFYSHFYASNLEGHFSLTLLRRFLFIGAVRLTFHGVSWYILKRRLRLVTSKLEKNLNISDICYQHLDGWWIYFTIACIACIRSSYTIKSVLLVTDVSAMDRMRELNTSINNEKWAQIQKDNEMSTFWSTAIATKFKA